MILSQINVGGPCKLNDNGSVIYFEDGVKLTTEVTLHDVGSDVGGPQDATKTDIVMKITGRPKSIWNATYRGVLLPAAYTNWTTAGGLLCGAANRAVSILGSDAHGYTFTRACLTKMPDVYLGLGAPLYGEAEWTAFIGTGKATTDIDAFYTQNTTAWDQSDYPTGNQEQLCTMAWGAVVGWDTVYAETAFKLTHEFKVNPIKQGNITVDFRIQGYRAMLGFIPQEPTETQLLAALALQGANAGIGTRLSSAANDAVVTGTGISVTVKNAAAKSGTFLFDNKANRLGEIGMITALSVPGTRLVLA